MRFLSGMLDKKNAFTRQAKSPHVPRLIHQEVNQHGLEGNGSDGLNCTNLNAMSGYESSDSMACFITNTYEGDVARPVR